MTTSKTVETKTVEPALARGLDRKNAPQSARSVRELRKKTNAKNAMPKKSKGAKIVTKPKTRAKGTFTTVDLATQHKINPKSLRARIRRNLDAWAPLFKEGERHVFADNKTTHKKCDALIKS